MADNGHKPPTEYGPGTEFPGVVARTTEESTPAWPQARSTGLSRLSHFP